MKRLVAFLCVTVLLMATVLPAGAALLLQQSFEAAPGTGWTVSPTMVTTGTVGDYFDRYTIATKPSGLSTLLGSLDGSYFLAGEDMNGTLPLPADAIYTVTIDAVAVAGYNTITVSIALNGKNANNYDTAALANGDYLRVYYNMDGAGDVMIGQFTKVGASGSGGKLGQDTNPMDGLGDVEIPDYNNFNNYTFSVPVTGNSMVVKIIARFESGDEEIVFDNVRVNGEPAAANEVDAHVTAGGAGASATISSLLDTEGEAQVVMTFNVQDDGSGSLSQNTIINSLSISQGDANTVTDWTTVIAGAKLTDGTNTWTGTVGGSSLLFSGAPLTTLLDNSAVQTWSLKIWLKTNLPYTADNEILEFRVAPSSFITDPSSAQFVLTDPALESGDTNNKIDIVATRLSITTQPPAFVVVNANFTVRAGFTDVNGGIDEDWVSENITLSLNTGTGVLSSVSGLSKASTSGQSAWTDLQYNTVESGIVLQAVSVTYPTPVLTNVFKCVYPQSITADAYPTCWDGNNTDQAVPFAVHITIQNWMAMANQPVYVKVYSGSFNPYHYTTAYGWSSLTNYDRKPIVTLDADGSWSGWLALKSAGMATFAPRAASVAGTSTNLTGTAITGTLLTISPTGNGAILEDRDLSTLTTPGNVVAVRNGLGTIIGMWISEDNGYPLDDGGTPINPGGWRLAVCSFCNVPTIFESWNPGTWPGHGQPFRRDSVAFICANPGDVVEVYDVILPVQLLSFAAVAGNGEVTLRWETATETDNDHFEIVRDGARMTTVRGAGTSATAHSYTWTDETVQNGVTYRYTLTAVDVNGSVSELGTAEATPREDAGVVHEYALYQNYPNPFNPTTNIMYDVKDAGLVTLKVCNMMGQEVTTLVNAERAQGRYTVSFNATNLPSGVYLCKMTAGSYTSRIKMLLMK
jgi:hypothetical protein